MAEDVPTASGDGVPPAGEQVHLPGASYLPAWTAFGITIALVGVVLNWVIAGIGAVIAVVAIWKWIGETRRDISQLPLEH
jgi:Cytochrome c oxidase subunit IV